MRRFLLYLFTSVMLLAAGSVSAQNRKPVALDSGFGQMYGKVLRNSSFDKASNTVASAMKLSDVNADDDPLKLYGMLVQRNSWNDQTAPAAFGMYSFNVVTEQENLEFKPLFLDERMISTNSGVYKDGKFYLFYRQLYYGMFQSLTLLVFDAENGTVLDEIPVAGARQKDVPYSLTYDPTTKNVYGYVQDTDENYMPVDILVTVDLETGKTERIGNLSDTFFALVTTYTGVLYGISDKGILKTIDKKTGVSTVVGDTGYKPLFNQSATIDQRSGEMYWAYYTMKEGKLLKVNLETAETTELVPFPDGENFIGLHTRTKVAGDAAPGNVENIRVRFRSAGSMDAVISATAPLKKFDDTELTENVTMNFYVNDVLVGSADNVLPGNYAEVGYTFDAEGLYRVSVSASLGNEEGPKETVETYAGIDTPQGVQNLVFTLNESTGEYTLTWDAPSEIGVNNGLIDVENLKYRVVAYPSYQVVKDNFEGTSISGVIESDDLNNYFFGVTVICHDKESAEVQSNRIKYGKAIKAPFNEDFETDMTWDLYTIRDVNNDGYTWVLEEGRASYKGYNSTNAGNDWLFTPPVMMYAGVTYTLYVTFDGGYWQTENFTIAVSPGTDVTNPKMEVLYNKSQEFLYGQVSVEYVPEQTGINYFGFKCSSNAGVRGISIDSYNIVAGASPDAPADVDNLVVTPGELGVLNATLTFNAPEKTVSGDNLADGVMTSIAVYRDGEFSPIKVFDSPVKGQKYEYLDTEAIHGINTYKLVSYSEDGNSQGVTASAWVGEDYATKPLNFVSSINNADKTVRFSWDAPLGGMHDGYVDMDNITYTLMFVVPELTENYNIIAENIKGNSYTDSEVMRTFLEMDSQYDIIFAVAAVTGAGMGEPASDVQSTGSAYGVPYWESFSNGYLTTAPWTVYYITDTEKDSWLLVEDSNSPFGVTSYDGDNGCAMFYQQQCDAESRLIGPKINLKGTTLPVLRFYVYHDITVSENNYLQMEVREEAGSKDDFVSMDKPVLVNNGKYGWIGHEISMEDYVDFGEFRLSFHGVAEKDVDFYVDNISINEAGLWNGYPSVSDLSAERTADNKVILSWSKPGNEAGFEILGYDVYMDGEKNNQETVEALNYSIQLSDSKAHEFKVVTVCRFGYSVDSNVANVGEVGISENTFDLPVVYSYDGSIVVDNCQDKLVGICSVDGKLVYSGNVLDKFVIDVEAGVYLVNIDGRSYKVIVK